MNRKDFITSWQNTPDMRPAFVMIKDVPRMGDTITYEKGLFLYGTDDRNSFYTIKPGYGGVLLPINSVKFVGYVDINRQADHIVKQFEVLTNA